MNPNQLMMMSLVSLSTNVYVPHLRNCSGPSTGMKRRRGDRSEEQLALKKFQNMISMLHSQITQHRNGNIFHNPIRTVEAPDYHDIVKRPMDLKTIKARVKDGLIANSLEYQRDCLLMFANAMMYNPPGSDVYQMAEDVSLIASATYVLNLKWRLPDDARQRRLYQCIPTNRRSRPQQTLNFLS